MKMRQEYKIISYPICLSPSIPLPSSWKLFADEMATGHGESNGGESRLGREGDPILRSKKEPLFDVHRSSMEPATARWMERFAM